MTLQENNAALDRFVEKAGTLYSLPAVAVEVLQLTNHPTIDVRRLKQCIANDPALVSKVLRVVNSSLFALSREVSDLNQALALLGTKPLKLLVLGFSLPDTLFIGVAGDLLRRYWRRTLTKAVAAREISETLWNLPGDEAFLAGLLQDIGMLVLLQEVGEPYARFLDMAFAKAADVGSVGRQSLGFDHAQLRARLLERWGLPASLVWAIAAGRPPEKLAGLPVATCGLPQILYLAELLAALLTENRSDLLPDLLEVGSRLHNLTPSQLTALVNALQEKVEQLADALTLDLPAAGDYNEVLAQAHSRLSEVAADAAADLLKARGGQDTVADSEALLAEVQSLAIALREMARPIKGPAMHPGGESGIKAAPTAGRLAADHAAAPIVLSASLAPPPPRGAAAAAAPVIRDPGLLGVLATIVASCRQSHCPVSLVVIGIDRFDELVLTRGPAGAQRMVGLIGTMCHGIGQSEVICRQLRDDRFMLLLPGLDRRGGVELGQQLLHELRRVGAPGPNEAKPTMTVSVGVAAVALPPKNFPPENLLDGAERCLHVAQLSGGNTLKSIEIY